jgi:hypothetical protein
LRQAPNPKHQITNKFQSPKSKILPNEQGI